MAIEWLGERTRQGKVLFVHEGQVDLVVVGHFILDPPAPSGPAALPPSLVSSGKQRIDLVDSFPSLGKDASDSAG